MPIFFLSGVYTTCVYVHSCPLLGPPLIDHRHLLGLGRRTYVRRQRRRSRRRAESLAHCRPGERDRRSDRLVDPDDRVSVAVRGSGGGWGWGRPPEGRAVPLQAQDPRGGGAERHGPSHLHPRQQGRRRRQARRQA